MSDDLVYEHVDATLADVVYAMVVQMEQHGQQFYAYLIGRQWAVFWNGPVRIH